jgi:hypothetical protein
LVGGQRIELIAEEYVDRELCLRLKDRECGLQVSEHSLTICAENHLRSIKGCFLSFKISSIGERIHRGELVTRIKKVVITAFGAESKLAIVESNLPEPFAREVQLAVEYTIASGSDVNMRRGIDPFQKRPPLTPGYSIIGKVRANGNDCSKFKTSDCVACLWKYEGQAELINLPEKYLVPILDGVDGGLRSP